MDLVTGFATIVGLLGVWKAEHKGRDDKNYDAYLDWLRRQEHGQLVELIVANEQLSKSLRGLVEDQHGEVLAKLEQLDRILAGVASHIGEFASIAIAIRPEAKLSDQAISVLKQMNQENAVKLLEIPIDGGKEYMLLGERNDGLEVADRRFIEDDLLTLCEFGLLRLDFNKSGERLFAITRNGAALGDA